jgi:hypothetical protein
MRSLPALPALGAIHREILAESQTCGALDEPDAMLGHVA